MTTVSAPSSVRASQIHPRPERLLVRRLKKAEKTGGGIYLPEITQEISQMGVVVAVGEKTEIPVDSWIIFSIYAATPCVATSEDWDEDLLFVREHDVLAVVEFEPDELRKHTESTTEVIAQA